MALTRPLLFGLAAVAALGSLATHMFVPAMPAIAGDLGAPGSDIQLAVTLYLIGLGIGQFAAGPVCDRLGRKPVILVGLALFTAGSIGSAIAGDVAMLLAARVVQALGGSATMLAARTMVADLSAPGEMSARLASMVTVVLISPALAPLIGGFIAAHGDWHAIFLLLAIAGAAGLVLCAVRIGESRTAPTSDRRTGLRHSYVRLLSNPRFCRYALAIACASSALYIFLSGSSFLLIDHYGLGSQLAGLCYFAVAACGIAGTLLVARLDRTGGAFRIGLGAAALGGSSMLVLAAMGLDTLWTFMGPMALMGLGTGIAAPSGMAGAMQAEPGLEGTGASLAGALQMIVSGLISSIIAQVGDISLMALAQAICITGIAGFLIAPAARPASG